MRAFGLAIGLCALVLGCRDKSAEQTPAPEQGNPALPQKAEPRPAQPAQSTQATQPARPGGALASGEPEPRTSAVTCRPGAEVEQMGARLMDMADTNGDGKVSREEGLSLTNFLVGGFFFRADVDGNGTVTPDEGRQARVELMGQYPAVAALFRSARAATGKSPFQTLANLLDVEYGKPLTIAEARDAARNAVGDLFALADANGDSAITQAEARDAAVAGARALGHLAFRSADKDGSGKLSRDELQQALQASGDAAFALADTNKDGALSQEEAATATSYLAQQVGLQPASGQ